MTYENLCGTACAATFRIQLPDILPPSFKGSAVRYSYQLEAKATFAPQSWRGGTPSSTTQSSDFHSQSSTPTADSPPQRTVHALNAIPNSSPHLVRYSSSSNLKLSRGREAVGQQQRKGPGIVNVKTPVHLWPAVSPHPSSPQSSSLLSPSSLSSSLS